MGLDSARIAVMTTLSQLPEPKEPRSADAIVGEAVRVMTRRRGMTQHALAEALGVHETTLGQKMNGRRPWYLWELQKAANALDVDAAAFLAGLPRLDSNQQPSGYLSALVRTGAVTPIEAGKRLRHTFRAPVLRSAPARVLPLQG